jgi:hypothetical protein
MNKIIFRLQLGFEPQSRRFVIICATIFFQPGYLEKAYLFQNTSCCLTWYCIPMDTDTHTPLLAASTHRYVNSHHYTLHTYWRYLKRENINASQVNRNTKPDLRIILVYLLLYMLMSILKKVWKKFILKENEIIN